MAKQYTVSVVIPAYNEEAVLDKCLQSLKQQDFSQDFEIVVCDNNSTDKTAEIAQKYGATVVTEERKGSRFAYDTGMRKSSGDLILATNADIEVPHNWVSSIVNAYEQDEELVGVGTDVKFKEAPKYVDTFFQFFRRINPTPNAMWGVSMSCKRWAYEKVGGFDQGINTNEDGIFSLLLMEIGKVTIVEDVVVEMNSRRFNRSFWQSAKEWFTGIGLNGLYIQINYLLTGKIRALNKDFNDVREQKEAEREEENKQV